jgi:hypothetical protein
MNRRTAVPVLLCLSTLVLATPPATAFEFDVSPNRDGSLDLHLALDWEYSPMFFSGIAGDYRNTSEQEEGESLYYATFGKTLAASVDLLGVRWRFENARAQVVANLDYENMRFREIGYTDVTEGADTTRYFILNDRVITLVMPRLTGEATYLVGPLRLSAGGEYAPWLRVGLNQTLEISPGMEATPFESTQFASNAFSVNGSARINAPVIGLTGRVEYDSVAIVYEALTAAGEQTIDAHIRTLSTEFGLVLSMISISGLSPTVGMRVSWDWTGPSGSALADLQPDRASDLILGFEL